MPDLNISSFASVDLEQLRTKSKNTSNTKTWIYYTTPSNNLAHKLLYRQIYECTSTCTNTSSQPPRSHHIKRVDCGDEQEAALLSTNTPPTKRRRAGNHGDLLLGPGVEHRRAPTVRVARISSRTRTVSAPRRWQSPFYFENQSEVEAQRLYCFDKLVSSSEAGWTSDPLSGKHGESRDASRKPPSAQFRVSHKRRC